MPRRLKGYKIPENHYRELSNYVKIEINKIGLL